MRQWLIDQSDIYPPRQRKLLWKFPPTASLQFRDVSVEMFDEDIVTSAILDLYNYSNWINCLNLPTSIISQAMSWRNIGISDESWPAEFQRPLVGASRADRYGRKSEVPGTVSSNDWWWRRCFREVSTSMVKVYPRHSTVTAHHLRGGADLYLVYENMSDISTSMGLYDCQ